MIIYLGCRLPDNSLRYPRNYKYIIYGPLHQIGVFHSRKLPCETVSSYLTSFHPCLLHSKNLISFNYDDRRYSLCDTFPFTLIRRRIEISSDRRSLAAIFFCRIATTGCSDFPRQKGINSIPPRSPNTQEPL